jgi:chromosome segregation ATPase
VSSVGHARALAEEGNSIDNINAGDISVGSIREPPSPNGMRKSLGTGGTTKVLADLQAGVLSARAALENTKSQLRQSQRTVAQLTRQTEDLKDSRERLRLENEGLNNVVARKERLLQEVLERARKAEAEVITLKTQLKTETSTSKRTIRELEASTAEAAAVSHKSEREYLTLRDSLSSMVEGWKSEIKELKNEMKRREDRWAKDAEEMGAKYRSLVKLIQKSERSDFKEAVEGVHKVHDQAETYFREEIGKLSELIQTSAQQAGTAEQTSQELSAELARLRRLMRSSSRVFAASDIPILKSE